MSPKQWGSTSGAWLGNGVLWGAGLRHGGLLPSARGTGRQEEVFGQSEVNRWQAQHRGSGAVRRGGGGAVELRTAISHCRGENGAGRTAGQPEFAPAHGEQAMGSGSAC